MNKTFVASLNNHNVYLISDEEVSFYLNVLKINDTSNITLDIDYRNKNIISDVINYYEKIDTYNISLVIPSYKIDNKKDTYRTECNKLSKIINMSYNFLIHSNIKVKEEINVIKHSKTNDFVTYFNSKFSDRITYITLEDLVALEVPYNKITAANINFVVGKPELNLTLKDDEMEEVIKESTKEVTPNNTVVSKQRFNFATSGYVSYYLLGVLTSVVTLLVITLLMKQ